MRTKKCSSIKKTKARREMRVVRVLPGIRVTRKGLSEGVISKQRPE